MVEITGSSYLIFDNVPGVLRLCWWKGESSCSCIHGFFTGEHLLEKISEKMRPIPHDGSKKLNFFQRKCWIKNLILLSSHDQVFFKKIFNFFFVYIKTTGVFTLPNHYSLNIWVSRICLLFQNCWIQSEEQPIFSLSWRHFYSKR